MEIALVILVSALGIAVITVGFYAALDIGRKRCMNDWLAYGKTCDHKGREVILDGARFIRDLRIQRGERDED